MNTPHLFSENMKMSDLLAENPQLILTLSRFGIKLGFGEKRIIEICQLNNVPSNLFILICNVYSFNSFLPQKEEIENINGVALIEYLRASHKYYLQQRLSHIEKHILKIAEMAGSVLTKFYKEYQKEVQDHFEHEEKIVFPYIIKLLNNGSRDKNYTIENFESAHTNIEDKLNDLTNIIIKYLSPDIMTEERISVWFDLVQVSKDMSKHDLIEEKILIPYVKHLEDRKS